MYYYFWLALKDYKHCERTWRKRGFSLGLRWKSVDWNWFVHMTFWGFFPPPILLDGNGDQWLDRKRDDLLFVLLSKYWLQSRGHEKGQKPRCFSFLVACVFIFIWRSVFWDRRIIIPCSLLWTVMQVCVCDYLLSFIRLCFELYGFETKDKGISNLQLWWSNKESASKMVTRLFYCRV